MPNIINFMIRSNCPKSYNEFLGTYFFNLGKFLFLEFFWTVTSETVLKKKATVQLS